MAKKLTFSVPKYQTMFESAAKEKRYMQVLAIGFVLWVMLTLTHIAGLTVAGNLVEITTIQESRALTWSFLIAAWASWGVVVIRKAVNWPRSARFVSSAEWSIIFFSALISLFLVIWLLLFHEMAQHPRAFALGPTVVAAILNLAAWAVMMAGIRALIDPAGMVTRLASEK